MTCKCFRSGLTSEFSWLILVERTLISPPNIRKVSIASKITVGGPTCDERLEGARNRWLHGLITSHLAADFRNVLGIGFWADSCIWWLLRGLNTLRCITLPSLVRWSRVIRARILSRDPMKTELFITFGGVQSLSCLQ